MKVKFSYEADSNLKVTTVSLVGSMNGYDPSKHIMRKVDGAYVIEVDLSPGEHHYAFLVNGNLRLNDPTANIYVPDEKDTLWSVVIINENHERLFNNTQYTTHIEEYRLSSLVSKGAIAVHKRQFNRFTDEKAVARFTFLNTTGLHTVTLAWYSPDGRLFQVSENYLVEDPANSEAVQLWFWMDLKQETKVAPGLWTLKLFLNGSYILEDKFQIVETSSYKV